METANDRMNALRAGLLGMGESSAAGDFLDYLKFCDSARGIRRFLGICYLTHHSFLVMTEKEKPASPESAGTAEIARKNMADLRKIAEILDRCGVENPEGISLDVIDRDGQEDYADRFCEICGALKE